LVLNIIRTLITYVQYMLSVTVLETAYA